MNRDARGFTLIELSVVLLLLGVLLAIVAPGLGRLYARIAFNSALQEVANGIASLPLLAYALAEEGTLEQLAARHIALPEGWSLTGADSVYIRANGLCSGGTVQLQTPTGARTLELVPPLCVRGTPD